jgi:hypothetical protein
MESKVKAVMPLITYDLNSQAKHDLGSTSTCKDLWLEQPNMFPGIGRIFPQHISENNQRLRMVVGILSWKWNYTGWTALTIRAKYPQISSHKQKGGCCWAIKQSVPHAPWGFGDVFGVADGVDKPVF